MPITDRVEPEAGMTFGEGMDRTALQMTRGDGLPGTSTTTTIGTSPHDELHQSGIFLREKAQDAKQDLRDYSHNAAEETKGVFGRIGDWFSHKGEEIKDSRVGTTVDRAGSGLEARLKEERAKLNRNFEEASERHDDSIATKIGHKAEEAKEYGIEKLQGLKADFRKEQVKDDLGLKSEPRVDTTTTSSSSSSSPLSSLFSSSTDFKTDDPETRRLVEAQKIVEKPDTHLTERLRHRVLDGKQMHPEHIEAQLGSGITDRVNGISSTASPAATQLPEYIANTDMDVTGVHAATRDTIRAQNQAERDMFHGRGNIMTSGSDTGIRFDAAELPKFGTHSTEANTISDMMQDASLNRSKESQFAMDLRVDAPAHSAFHAFRTEDF